MLCHMSVSRDVSYDVSRDVVSYECEQRCVI